MRQAVVRTKEFIAKLQKIKCEVTIKELIDLFGEINFVNCSRKIKMATLGKGKMTQLDKVERACLDEMEFLARNLEHPITSLPSSITQYRRVIKAFNDNHPAILFFKLPRDEYRKRNANYFKGIDTQNRDLIAFSRKQIQPYVKMLVSMLNSDDYAEVAVALCGLTGRRPGEILHSGTFIKVHKGKWKNSVVFTGQLKTKAQTKEDERKPFEIPILCSPKLVINGLDKLRKMPELQSLVERCEKMSVKKTFHQHLNSLFSKWANEVMIDKLNSFFPNDVDLYDLRRLYATIALDLFHNKEKMTMSAFLSDILGHVEGKEGKLDLTFKSYEKFSLVG